MTINKFYSIEMRACKVVAKVVNKIPDAVAYTTIGVITFLAVLAS